MLGSPVLLLLFNVLVLLAFCVVLLLGWPKVLLGVELEPLERVEVSVA